MNTIVRAFVLSLCVITSCFGAKDNSFEETATTPLNTPLKSSLDPFFATIFKNDGKKYHIKDFVINGVDTRIISFVDHSDDPQPILRSLNYQPPESPLCQRLPRTPSRVIDLRPLELKIFHTLLHSKPAGATKKAIGAATGIILTRSLKAPKSDSQK